MDLQAHDVACQGEGKLLVSQLPLRDVGPLLIPHLLVPFVLFGYMGIFLAALIE